MTQKKHHYRLVAKSDHLGAADLEDLIENGSNLIFTIKEVKQEMGASVAGKKGNFNIAYFKEAIKPLVLNQTNAKTLRNFAKDRSPFVEDWNNILVQLKIDYDVKMKGETVAGVRIEERQPKLTKPDFTEANFAKAKEKGATIEQIKQVYTLTKEMEDKYNEFAKK